MGIYEKAVALCQLTKKGIAEHCKRDLQNLYKCGIIWKGRFGCVTSKYVVYSLTIRFSFPHSACCPIMRHELCGNRKIVIVCQYNVIL